MGSAGEESQEEGRYLGAKRGVEGVEEVGIDLLRLLAVVAQLVQLFEHRFDFVSSVGVGHVIVIRVRVVIDLIPEFGHDAKVMAGTPHSPV